MEQLILKLPGDSMTHMNTNDILQVAVVFVLVVIFALPAVFSVPHNSLWCD